MAYPRRLLVPPDAPGIYHCVSRCVRRAFHCGEDAVTGRSFEHRKQPHESLGNRTPEGACSTGASNTFSLLRYRWARRAGTSGRAAARFAPLLRL